MPCYGSIVTPILSWQRVVDYHRTYEMVAI